MRDPARILVVDDNPANREILGARLARQGYEILTAEDGIAALAMAREHTPDLILLDVMMPGKDGLAVCRELKGDASLPFMPIILVTAKADPEDVIAGLDCGGDEYVTKPIDHAALLARVRSILRIKALHDTVESQAAELKAWNGTLERRVQEQLDHVERLGRLKRFLPPEVAELILASGDLALLDGRRREVTLLYCDLRGFTAFAEAAEPEEVMAVLGEYHATLGGLAQRFQATVERFVGDGMTLLLNDPLPCPDHALQAVRLAAAMREAVSGLAERWRRQGHELGFGVGIASGYATVGRIGFEGRFDYAAIGTVANLASRLCDEARAGDILVTGRVLAVVDGAVEAEPVGELDLKGLHRPVSAYNIRSLRG
jgi:adenylate cyclase